MSYVQGDLSKPELYEDIRGALDAAANSHGTQGNAIFYLAVADRLFGTVVEQLGNAKLTDQNADQDGKRRFWRRVVIEKPFGHSLDSARALNADILRTFRQWAVRTDLEPRADRSRADHRGGDGGRRAARQVLRGDRGAA
jgi:glucose-6-phosphate 1-dehydrogenase